jgi:antitoxin component YwqK of YwqJK toxin-antitoxin module
MKSILFTLLTFLSFQTFAQETNKMDEKGQRHGLWKGTYEASKRPRYEGTFDHGKETGTFKFFDDTKELKVIATRDFSAKDGSAYTTFFDQKGNKVSEGKEVNKLAEGEWKYYHFESKEIMSTENYSKGKLNGVKKVFYKNGKIAEETTYANGIKNGPYKKYSEKGDVFEDATYKNDQFDGPVTYNDGAGKTIKGQFKDGKKSGKWKYFQNGKLTKEEDPNKAKKEKFKIDSKNKGARKQKQNQPKG